MIKFTCESFRPIKKNNFVGDLRVDTPTDAAKVFAQRLVARRGKGYSQVRLDSCTADGTVAQFQVSIIAPNGVMTDVWLTVRSETII